MADHSYNHLSVHPNQNPLQVASSNSEQQAGGNSNKNLIRGNSVATLNQIYQHHNSIPVRNRILNTAKSLYSSVEVPAFVSGGPDSLPDAAILLPAGGTSAQRYAMSPGDRTPTRMNYVAGQQQQQKSVQSSQLMPSSSSAFHHQQRLQQQQNPTQNVQATPPSKHPTHSLATSPVRIINVARRHRKQTSGSVINQHETYVTGGTRSSSSVGLPQTGLQSSQAWRQSSQQQQPMVSNSPKRNKLTAWSSDSSSCSSSRDASPIQGSSPAQQRSPTNPTRQLEVQHQQQLPQQAALPRSSSPSPTMSRSVGQSSGQLVTPTPSETSPSQQSIDQSLKQHQNQQQRQQQKSPSPRRRVLPKIGTTNQSQSFAPDTSPVHQSHSYLEASSAAVMTAQVKAVEAALQQATQQPTNTSTKRHRKLPQIPTQASVQQLGISYEQSQFSSGNQLQSETTIQGSSVGGSSYAPNIPARRVAPNKSLSSSSSASSNSPTVLAESRGNGLVLQQPVNRQQTLGLNNSPTSNVQSASVRNQNLANGEQLRVLSFPMPSENQLGGNSANTGPSSLVSSLVRAKTLVHPPSFGAQNRSVLSGEQCSNLGQQQQQQQTTSQFINQALVSNAENNSLDNTSPTGQMNRISGYKQVSPVISRQRHSASSSSSSNSPAGMSGNNRSPSYSQQHQMSRYFTFEQAQALTNEPKTPSLITTAPSAQSSPYTNYGTSEKQGLAAPSTSCSPQIVSDEAAETMAMADENNSQLDHQLNVLSGNIQNQQANSAGRGRRLSTCGSGLRANFLMNKQHAISEFTPPRSLESSTSRGSTDASGVSQMMPCTTSVDGSLAPNSYTQPTTPTRFAPEDLMGVGVANSGSGNGSGNNNSNLDWTSTANNINLNLATNKNDCLVSDDNNSNNNFEHVGVAGNRSLSTQNIRSCGTATLGKQAGNFMFQNMPMISPANSSLIGQSSHQVAHLGSGISSSNCDLQFANVRQQQQQQQQHTVHSINNALISPRFTNNSPHTSSACPIVSIGNYTTVANYMQRRPSAALAGLPPRAASATEASSLQPCDVLNTARSSNLAPTNFTESDNFHRTLSANVKLAPAARSMIMQSSSANYVTSSDAVAFAGNSGTFCSGKPILATSTSTSAATTTSISTSTATATLTTPSAAVATAASTTKATMGSNFSRERRLLPSLAATNARSVDVYHNVNEDSYIIPSAVSSASVATSTTTLTTNLSPLFVGGQVKQKQQQQFANTHASEQRQQYTSQYDQRNSLALPSPRDRQHSNVSTNSMPAGVLTLSSANNSQQQQASYSTSPGYCSPNQAATNCSPLAASLSQASSGEAQKARKFGAWAERIAASNSAASGKARTGAGLSKQASGRIKSSSSSTSRRHRRCLRARSTSQLDGPSSGQRSGLTRSISDSSSSGGSNNTTSSDNGSSGDNEDGKNEASYSNNNRSSARLVGETGESETSSGDDDSSSVDSRKLSQRHHHHHHDNQHRVNSNSSSSSYSDSSSLDDGNTTSSRRNRNEFERKKETILARRQKRRRHKQNKLSSRPKSNKMKQEETMTAIIAAGGKSVDQLTLSDRLKLAEKSANELFRKVELSPQYSAGTNNKQGSLDSSSTATNQATQNAFFSSPNNPIGAAAGSGLSQSKSKMRPQGDSSEDQQFYLKNNKLDDERATQIDISAPKGGGESHEFADDEQGDDLSLFLRSVDKQRLKQQQHQHDSSGHNRFSPNNSDKRTLCKMDRENATTAATNNNNNNNDNNNNNGNSNAFSSNPSTKLNKQTSKLLRNVKGSLRLGKMRQNNGTSGFHNTSLRQHQSLATKDEMMMMHHYQQTMMGNNAAAAPIATDAEAVKTRLRAPRVVRRAITLRSLAKTFNWRASSCEPNSQQQQTLTSKSRANSSQTATPSFDVTDDDPQSNLHARLLTSSVASLNNPTTISPISASADASAFDPTFGRRATDDAPQTTPPSIKDPSQQETRSSSSQWLFQSATANPFSSFQRTSLSSFTQRLSTSSQRGEKGSFTGVGMTKIKRGSQSRNSSGCSVEEAVEFTQPPDCSVEAQSARIGKLSSKGNFVRGGSAVSGYCNVPADYNTEQNYKGTSSTNTLPKHHRSLGRMKSVITTVSRRLETLRLMKGKQAHSDDCPATANCSDNSGDIRYDTRNSYDYNDFTDIENGDNNNNSKSRNNNFGQHLR